MFLFGNDDDAVSYGVLIDVSSGSVGIAIAESNPESPAPTILYSERISMRITKHGAEESENIRRIKETLFSASLTLSQDGIKALHEHNPKARLSKMYVTCSTPWSYTTARNVYYEEDGNFRVTDEIIDDLVKGAESEMLSEATDADHIKGDVFEIVERATVDYAINDYAIENPRKLSGKTFGLTHIGGLVPSEIFDSIEEIHTKFFPQTELKVHTYMFAMYCVLRDLFPTYPSLLIIDVTAETTEYALVEDSILTENTFTASGSSSFIRDTMTETGQPASDIQSLMSTESGTTHLDSSKIAQSINAYKKQISEMILKLQEKKIVPNTIVVTSQMPYEYFFASTILDCLEAFFENKPKVLDLKQEIQKISSFGSEIDVYLMILTQFFHKSHKCGEPSE